MVRRWCAWILLFWLAQPWASVCAEGAADGSELPGAVRIVETIPLPVATPSGPYTHMADLHVYVTSQHAPPWSLIQSEVGRAQEAFDQCGILLRLRSLNRVSAPPLLAQWESLEFNAAITPWETALFTLTPPYSAGIVYVDNLDWTIGHDGITAIGYAPFVETETDYLRDARERTFFRTHVAGHAVLGRHSGRWTLAHELGHAVMDLRHVDDRDNVMFGGQLTRGDALRFEPAQCARGRANTPWVKPVPTPAGADGLVKRHETDLPTYLRRPEADPSQNRCHSGEELLNGDPAIGSGYRSPGHRMVPIPHALGEAVANVRHQGDTGYPLMVCSPCIDQKDPRPTA